MLDKGAAAVGAGEEAEGKWCESLTSVSLAVIPGELTTAPSVGSAPRSAVCKPSWISGGELELVVG